jgi:protein-L-isoaspartate(D-aspartate) O-methyltransferase
MSELEEQRRIMVDEHLERRGIRDPLLLQAFRDVRREDFVPPEMKEFAYDDRPLPIGEDQTISQPYIVALMTQALGLRGGERVLEIGTGSGYAAAIAGRLAGEVFTVERLDSLARSARERLERLEYHNVHVRSGDGTLGWPERAPFDAVVVTAGGPQPPRALLSQLAIGGRLVIPVGARVGIQRLVRLTRETEDEYREEDLGGVRFVELIGEQGFDGTRRARPSELL